MKIREYRLSKEVELLEQIYEIGNKLRNCQIKSIEDLLELCKFFEKAVKNLKSCQKHTKEDIKSLKHLKIDDPTLKALRRKYLEYENTKAIFSRCLDVLVEEYDIYKYEPEKLADDKKTQDEINRKIIECAKLFNVLTEDEIKQKIRENPELLNNIPIPGEDS